MADESRNDSNIRHFISRSQQPKVLAGGPGAVAAATHGTSPVNVFIVFDQGFGGVSDQIDDTRFKYIGTTPQVSRYEAMCNRRMGQSCMQNSFRWH